MHEAMPAYQAGRYALKLSWASQGQEIGTPHWSNDGHLRPYLEPTYTCPVVESGVCGMCTVAHVGSISQLSVRVL